MTHRMLTLMVLAIMLSVFSGTAVFAEEQLKLAYVRSGYILSNYEPYIQAVKKYGDFERGEVEKLNKKVAEFQQKVVDSQKQAAFMTEDRIRERSLELEREKNELEMYTENLYNREKGILAKKYAELLKPIFDQVNKVIFKIRTDEGYAFIFEAESDAMIDADTRYDISDKVIEMLAQEAAKVSQEE